MSTAYKYAICRLCLGGTETHINLLDGNFRKILFEFTSIEISENDTFSKLACLQCVDGLHKGNSMRKRILMSDKKLRDGTFKEEQKVDQEITLENILLQEETNEKEDTKLKQLTLQDLINNHGSLQPDNLKKENIDLLVDSPNSDIIFVEEDTVMDPLEDTSFSDFTETKSCPVSMNSQLKATKTNSFFSDYDSSTNSMKTLNKAESFTADHTLEQSSLSCSLMKAIKDVFTTKRRMKVNVVARKPLKCETCDIDFKLDRYAYNLHLGKHKKSQCRICGIFIRSDNMHKHIECHTSGSRVCDLCGATCKNIESLRGHIFYMHRKKKDEYKCDQCKKCFRQKYKLELHKKKEHFGLRNHICETCKKGFFTVRDKTHHINMTHLKLRPHKCPHCSRGFSSKYALKTHVRQHTNETPYKCYVCAEGFRQNVSLRTHLKSKHDIEESKDFTCEFCDKAFSTHHALNVHMRLHSDDNYKCDLCVETFQQKTFLLNHLKHVHNKVPTNVVLNCMTGEVCEVSALTVSADEDRLRIEEESLRDLDEENLVDFTEMTEENLGDLGDEHLDELSEDSLRDLHADTLGDLHTARLEELEDLH